VQEATGEKIFNLISLDHTELLHPTMSDAPSVAKPMQLARLWPHFLFPHCATQMYLSFAGPVHSICSIKATIKYWIFTVINAQLVSP
jgi:hypothetical protein